MPWGHKERSAAREALEARDREYRRQAERIDANPEAFRKVVYEQMITERRQFDDRCLKTIRQTIMEEQKRRGVAVKP